ncbi:MAG: glycoside hydrolase family 88 protein [Phycisphaerae bacterium]|jgi:rhamnogalacturonyl hydrolase YesR
MKKILCVLMVVFLNVSASAKYDNKQIIKITNEVAENVLAVPVDAKYPTVCSYYGVLKFAEQQNNQKLIDAVKANYAVCPVTSEDIVYTDDKSTGADKRKLPRTNKIRAGHVDWNVFGILPFELYLQTKDKQYLKVAMELAEDEWAEPNENGMTAYTRLWVDDMFMVGALQVQAYKASGKEIFLERGLTQLLGYAKILQQDNGLFQHTAEVPIFWGRGNGWAAAVMALTLENMPKEHPKRQDLMDVYKKMMAGLKKYQAASGLWHQIIIDPASYEETSSTGMFTYAIATGIKNGWLDTSYRTTAVKGWNGLAKKVKDGQLADICVGTGAKNNYNHYLNRPTKTGDLHGQAAFLWAGTAMLEMGK